MTIWCELAWLEETFQPAVRIALSEQLAITHIEVSQPPQPTDRQLSGLVVPGFINAHCHLELSHLRGKIAPQTGMAGFIKELQQIRNTAIQSFKEESQCIAIQELKDSGVIGVADICNSIDSDASKKQFPEIWFHNFIEVFGLAEKAAAVQMAQADALAAAFPNSSVTPHAPYSTGDALLSYTSRRAEKIYSVHLLESSEEEQLFEQQSGALWELFSLWGLPISSELYQQDIITHIAKGVHPGATALWVHNNYLTRRKLETIIQIFPNSYFCLCPRANLFIHNKIPNFSVFNSVKGRLCLGTDSLAGTTSFDLLADAKIVSAHGCFSFGEILAMLTTNPARAFAWESELGSFEVGKRPGFNQLQPIQIENPELLPMTTVQPVIF